MCRIVAFPPFFPKKKAVEIVKDFYMGNEDGTGSVYLKDDKFVVNKYHFSFEEVMKKKLPLLDHMPYNGWTLTHVRAASHGKPCMNNTHPFVKGDNAMIHNGVFSEYAPVKAALSVNYKFKGQTDSEVAAVLYNVAGKKKFAKAMSSGVYMFLNKSGRVHVVCKAGGDLVFQKTKYGHVMASELPLSYRRKHTALEGTFVLGKNGLIIRSNYEKDDAATWKWVDGYEDFAPKRQNWKTKKKTVSLDSKFDQYPDEEDFTSDNTEFLQGKHNGYLWVR